MAPGDRAGWLQLEDGESIQWHRRPHPVALGRVALAGGVVLGIGVAVAWLGGNQWSVLESLGLVVALVGAAMIVWRYLRWTNTRYVVTTDRLYRKVGVVSRDVTQFHVGRVQNTTLRQSVLGRLLGYGDLTVYTAGSGDPELTFERVGDPHAANAVIAEQVGGSGRVSL